MLRSPITPNRTEVQHRPEMKQTTIRRIQPTPPASARSPHAPAHAKDVSETNHGRSLV